MRTPTLTPALAERSLTGAAAHALAVRTMSGSSLDANDYVLFRDTIGYPELADSAAAYAVSLTWWAYSARVGREHLMARTRDLLVRTARASAAHLEGYITFCHGLAQAALAPTQAAALESIDRVTRPPEGPSRLTAHYADASVRALLLSGAAVFGDSDVAPERMRTVMTNIAYLGDAPRVDRWPA